MAERIWSKCNQICRNLVYLLLILVVGCSDLDFPDGENSIEKPPDVELFGARIYFSTADEMRFSLLAPHISRFENSDQLTLEGGIKAQRYNSKGIQTDWLTSHSGEVFEREQRIMAYGNVVVKSDSGIVLYADTLLYNPKIDKIISDGFVIIVTSTDSITGYGFKAASDLTNWEIKNTSGVTWRELE